MVHCHGPAAEFPLLTSNDITKVTEDFPVVLFGLAL